MKELSLKELWGVRRGLVVFLLPLSFFISACAPNRAVYVPPEYRSSPPAQYSVPQAPPAAPVAPPPSQGPVLTRPPEFRKQDLPAGPPSQRQSPGIAVPAPPVPAKKVEVQSPQLMASMQFVNEARKPLDRGKPDLAIPVLERAIQADSQNAEAYMLLARAWRQKGMKQKALEFANKAEILYQDEPARLKEVFLLQSDLYKEMGNTAKAAQCRQKAAALR
ncbi:MAG: tetratricopeptide repeat protein [Syntrophobacteraceae bacterium]